MGILGKIFKRKSIKAKCKMDVQILLNDVNAKMFKNDHIYTFRRRKNVSYIDGFDPYSITNFKRNREFTRYFDIV